LISRLGFALALSRLEPAQSRDYVTARLGAVGVHANPFEDQALELLIQAAGGLPRAINHLAQAASRRIAWLSLAASAIAFTAAVCAVFIHVIH